MATLISWVRKLVPQTEALRFKFWCLVWPTYFSILFGLHVSCFGLCTKEHRFLPHFTLIICEEVVLYLWCLQCIFIVQMRNEPGNEHGPAQGCISGKRQDGLNLDPALSLSAPLLRGYHNTAMMTALSIEGRSHFSKWLGSSEIVPPTKGSDYHFS